MVTPNTEAILRWMLAVGAAAMFLAVGCGEMRGEATAHTEGRLQSLEDSCGTEKSFTARSVLQKLEEEYDAPLYFPRRAELTTVRLDVDYDGGALRCLPGDDDQASRIEIAANLRLHSSDGALHETIPGIVSGFDDSDQFRVTGRIPYAERDGAFASAKLPKKETELLVEGWIDVDEKMTQGAVRAIRPPDGGETETRHRTIATWDEGRHTLQQPNEPCGGRPKFTKQRYLVVLGSTRSAPAQFANREGSSTVRVTVSFADKSVVCEPASTSGEKRPRIASEVRVEIWASEGHLLESLMGHAHLNPDGRLSFRATGPETSAEKLSYATGILDSGRSYRPRATGSFDSESGALRGALSGVPSRGAESEPATILEWGRPD